MQKRRSVQHAEEQEPSQHHHQLQQEEEMPYQAALGNFQSFCLLLLVMGSLEVGFFYTTILGYILMTIAYYEMTQVQQSQEKEEKIQIKTQWFQWYCYFTVQFKMIPSTWLTQELIFDSEITMSPLLQDVLFKYHTFFTFVLIAVGLVFFVLSLEEGFYAYQFRQMGWSILNLIVIVSAGHGLLISLWKLRLWFVYSIICMCLRDIADHIISHHCPIGPSMHSLTPKAKVFGYLIGALTAYAFYFVVADEMIHHEWFNFQPVKLGMTPFDGSAMIIDVSEPIYKQQLNHWKLGPFGDYQFEASQIQLHLFWITSFIAIVAPFGALFFTALKRALKAEQLGRLFVNGGVIDRVDCLLIVGLFLFLYINYVVYQKQEALKHMQDMILSLSPTNQQKIYDRLMQLQKTL